MDEVDRHHKLNDYWVSDVGRRLKSYSEGNRKNPISHLQINYIL